MITILGPTATGKTRFAALVADAIGGEIVSADSRQVYNLMNIGTGKDYDDYLVKGKSIPVHLIDIVEPGYEYNVFEFKRDAQQSINDIQQRGKVPVLCGGSGMYIEAVIGDYKLFDVPENQELSNFLNAKTDEELRGILMSYGETHNTTDVEIRGRLIKAIEIKDYYQRMNISEAENTLKNNLIFGIDFPRAIVRSRITDRLQSRFDSGMINEVQQLLDKGVPKEMLLRYGLEYRWITRYIDNEISYKEMFERLNIAIHQFSKRQMIWFRRMERKGYDITWVDSQLSDEERINLVLNKMKEAIPKE